MADRTGLRQTGRDFLLQGAKKLLFLICLLIGSAYILDYAVLRYRITANKTPFATVTVRPYYAVPQKNHRTEFLPGDAQDQACVNSLFPHLGDSPCWYLTRHKDQQINM